MFNRKNLLILLLFIIAVGTVSSVSAADVNNETVIDSTDGNVELTDDLNDNNLASVENDDETVDNVLKLNEKSFYDLQNLIDNAKSGSTISLTSDYYCDSDFEGYGVEINKPLTINGNGHTIDAQEYKGIFLIYSDGVVLNNIKFVNGYDDYEGGAALFILNNLTTVNNCQFIDNVAEKDGGAIYTSGRLVVNNCKFTGNRAENGAAIYAFYPDYGDESVTISGSTFENNRASSYGGAIYLDSDTQDKLFADGAAKSYIKNTVFRENQAKYGGAIFNFQYTDILNGEFYDNYASEGGGAIYMNNGYVIVEDDGDEFSQTYGLIIHGTSKFIGNEANTYGGAIRLYAAPDHVKYGVKGYFRVSGNTLFESNYAGTGGALSFSGVADAIVEDATFRYNDADSQGSAMTNGTAVRCVFEGNSAPVTYNTKIIENVEGKLTLVQSGSYYGDKTITVTLTNAKTNAPLSGKKVNIAINGKSVTLTTNSAGKATYKVPFAPGTYTATATVSDKNINAKSVKLSNIRILKAPITIAPYKLSTPYDSGKYFQVKVVNTKTKNAVGGVKLKLTIYTGRSARAVYVNTNSLGVAKYAASTLAIGAHKVIVSNAQPAYCTGTNKISSISVSKASYSIYAPRVSNAFKMGTFNIAVKNKVSGKVVPGVALTVKIYTGSKFSTLVVKTNAKGVASISTKTLAKGSHKVVINIKANAKYNAAAATSYINIVNKIPTKLDYEMPLVFYATHDGYHSHTYAVRVSVILKDNTGEILRKPVTLIHSGGYTANGYSGDSITVSGGRPGTVTIRFAGDSRYAASSYKIDLGYDI